MNKVNFDSLKSIKAPREWVDKAAAVPDTFAKKQAFPPLYRYVTAASVVLVSVIGLLAFLLFGNGTGSPVVIRDDAAATESRSDETVIRESAETSAPATDAQDNTVNANAENPSQPATGTQTTESALSPTSSAVPTSPRATEKTAPTESPAGHPHTATEETAVPDSPSTDPPEPTEPQPKPAEQPTTQKSTDPIDYPQSVISFFATFDASLIEECETIYCIYAPHGTASGTYHTAAKHKADYYITKTGLVCAYCDLQFGDDIELVSEEDTIYAYLFVNERGKVLARGTQAV